MACPENPCGCTPPTHPDPCGCKLSAAEVAYKGPNLGCTGIETCQTVEEILINLDQFICEGAFVQTIINNITNNVNILNQFTSIVNNIVDCETVQNCINPTTSTTTTEAPLDPNICVSYGANFGSTEVNDADFNLMYVETQNHCGDNIPFIEYKTLPGIHENIICVVEGYPAPESYFYKAGIKTYTKIQPYLTGSCFSDITTTSTTTSTATPSCIEVEINVGVDCEEGDYALFNYKDCAGVSHVVQITTGELPRICVLDNPFPFFSCGSGVIEVVGTCGVIPTTTSTTTIVVDPTTTTSTTTIVVDPTTTTSTTVVDPTTTTSTTVVDPTTTTSTTVVDPTTCNIVTLTSNFNQNIVFEYMLCGTSGWIPITLNNDSIIVCVKDWRTSAPISNQWSATIGEECSDVPPPPSTDLKITSTIPGELGDGIFILTGGETSETITLLIEFVSPGVIDTETFFIGSPPLNDVASLDSLHYSYTRTIDLGPVGTTPSELYTIGGTCSVKLTITGRSSGEIMPTGTNSFTIINNE